MKLIMMFILMLQLGTPANESLTSFDDQVNTGYETYIILKEESPPEYDYSLKIIQGINNDKISFGIMLYNINPQLKRTIIVSVNDRKYELPQTKRGDYILPSIKYSEDVTINIDNGNSLKPVFEISHMTPDHFKTINENLINGENQGIKMVSLSGSGFTLNKMGFISLLFGGVIIITSLIIFIFYKRKKGIFAEHKRSEDVFNYREFVNQYVNQNEELIANGNYTVPEQDIQEENLEPTKAYERQRFYEEEVEDFIDITKVLKEKGYNTNYEQALEFEKNEIMLELMRMRDQNEISKTQYSEETIKLWKK